MFDPFTDAGDEARGTLICMYDIESPDVFDIYDGYCWPPYTATPRTQ